MGYNIKSPSRSLSLHLKCTDGREAANMRGLCLFLQKIQVIDIEPESTPGRGVSVPAVIFYFFRG